MKSATLAACLLCWAPCAVFAEITKQEERAHTIGALIDPQALEKLTGKRAATPSLRRTMYWLTRAKRDGAVVPS